MEAIFRILDKDNSGQISLEEFGEACHLLHKHLPEHSTEEELLEMCKLMDINKDGLVDLNEFLEAFRLCDQSRRGARGRALIIGESLSLEKSSATPNQPGAVTPLLGEVVTMNGKGGLGKGVLSAFVKDLPGGNELSTMTTSEVDANDVSEAQGSNNGLEESGEKDGNIKERKDVDSGEKVDQKM